MTRLRSYRATRDRAVGEREDLFSSSKTPYDSAEPRVRIKKRTPFGVSCEDESTSNGALEGATHLRRTKQASLPHAYGLGEPACPEHPDPATSAVHRTLATLCAGAAQTRRTRRAPESPRPPGLSVLHPTVRAPTSEEPIDERAVLLDWSDP